MDRVAVFVDAEFLKREGSKALRVHPPVRVDAPAAIRYFRSRSEAFTQHRFLRASWYDAEYPREHPQFEKQQTYVRCDLQHPRAHLAPGQDQSRYTVLASRPAQGPGTCVRGPIPLERLGPIHIQKGVDTLLVLDLVRLAQKRAFDSAVLAAGTEICWRESSPPRRKAAWSHSPTQRARESTPTSAAPQTSWRRSQPPTSGRSSEARIADRSVYAGTGSLRSMAMAPPRTVTTATSPSRSSPRSTMRLRAFSTVRWMRRRRGRAP